MTPEKMTTLYEEYKGRIVKLANRFHQTHPHTELDDLVADGSLAFLQAVKDYDPELGKLENRIVFSIWKMWQEKDRTRAKRYRKTNATVDSVEEKESLKRSAQETAYNAASDDANTLIRIALAPPLDVKVNELLNRRAIRKAHKIRKAIVEYLRDIGWAWERIEEGFEEVRELIGK